MRERRIDVNAPVACMKNVCINYKDFILGCMCEKKYTYTQNIFVRLPLIVLAMCFIFGKLMLVNYINVKPNSSEHCFLYNIGGSVFYFVQSYFG